MTEDDDEINEIEGVTVEVNPYQECDDLCSAFFLKLDPMEHAEFLKRLLANPPAVWQRLVDLCEGIPNLPETLVQIRAKLADRVLVTHVPWPGASLDPNQPEHMVLIGNTQSLYFQAQLLSLVEGNGG